MVSGGRRPMLDHVHAPKVCHYDLTDFSSVDHHVCLGLGLEWSQLPR